MEEKKKISEGSACFLICDNSLSKESSQIYKWFRSEGFKCGKGHGYWGCPWVYVNLNNKLFAPGRPGIALTSVVCNHAITVSEFRTIYEIFKKYEGKEVFVFHKERFDYDKSI